MTTTLMPGTRLRSAVCGTEVVVLRASVTEVDLRCGGEPVVPVETAATEGRQPRPPFDGGTEVGKRYTTDDGTIEVLCTKAGAGSLSVGDQPMHIKSPKPLPASD